MSGYVVQYRDGNDEWRTYSRHRKIERAQDTKRRLEGFYAPLRPTIEQVRIVHEATALAASGGSPRA